MKGLHASIYESKSYGNCSNGGISSYSKNVTLVGNGIPEIFAADEEAPAVWVEPWFGHYRAMPMKGKNPKNIGWMFGGSFAYTSDSRMPGHQPIPLHDRQETVEQYRVFSM